MRRRTLLGAALACLAIWSSSASLSHADVRIDHVQVPFYARVIEGEKMTSVIFYRPPGCIPAEFNLITFFNVPRVFDCGPMSMDGYAIFENGSGDRPRPDAFPPGRHGRRADLVRAQPQVPEGQG